MNDPTGGEEVLRGKAAPRLVPKRTGQDPSNTPIEEITEDLDGEPGLARLAEIWSQPDTAEDTVRQSVTEAKGQ